MIVDVALKFAVSIVFLSIDNSSSYAVTVITSPDISPETSPDSLSELSPDTFGTKSPEGVGIGVISPEVNGVFPDPASPETLPETFVAKVKFIQKVKRI